MLMAISCMIAVLRVVAVLQSLGSEPDELDQLTLGPGPSHSVSPAEVHVQVFDDSRHRT